MSKTLASEHLSNELHELHLQNEEYKVGGEILPKPNIETILLLGVDVLISILVQLED